MSLSRSPLVLLSLLLACGACKADSSSPSDSDGPGEDGPDPAADSSLGPSAPIGFRPFPANNPWNLPIDTAQVDSASAKFVATIGINDRLHPDFGTEPTYGIPYVVVDSTQARVNLTFQWPAESDPGPYPIPNDAPVEGGNPNSGDRHVLVIDRDTRMLYEVYAAKKHSDHWSAGSGAIFDLQSNALRPEGWTSADAAGLPIFPGLVRYEEVAAGAINHAIRFTINRTRRAYTHPARHQASESLNDSLPPMGTRVRLKASVNIDDLPPQAKVIAQAMKTYGMILADNGSDWFFSGTSDDRWDDDQLNELKELRGSDFEVVKLGPITTVPLDD
jgi:hypothetical protein